MSELYNNQVTAADNQGSDESSIVVLTSEEYRIESEEARLGRVNQNAQNWDMYHLNQDFSDKRPGQSREVLPKQAMAVEQIVEYFQQALVDVDDWWRCDYKDGVNPDIMPIKKDEIKKILDRQLDKLNDSDGFIPFVGDSLKSGLLGSIIIVKIYGRKINRSVYSFENRVKPTSVKDKLKSVFSIAQPELEPVLKRGFRREWVMKLDLIMPYEFGMDPSARKLYEYHETYLDWSDAVAMATGPDAIYDRSILDKISSESTEDWIKKCEEARQTGQSVPTESRKKVKIREFWGSIVNTHTGEMLYENVTWTIANDRFLIQKPTPNPFWHGESPFVVSPIIRVPRSQWHKALMDSPTKLNKAGNELYNLMLDGGMMATYGIKQYRPDYMANEADAAEGFLPGQSIAVTSDCPPGAKVLEEVSTGNPGATEAMAMFNLTNAEFNAAALTNDLRMGSMPQRAVKATEVVESSNSITSIFTGISKILEIQFIQKVLEKGWKVCLQNVNDLDTPEMQAILGQDRATQIAALSPQERYAKCVDGSVFNVYGISKTLAKQKDFKKLVAFLQTVSASPILLQEFTQKYSMERLLGQLMSSLDINTSKLEMDPQEAQAAQMRMQASMQQQAALKAGGNVQSGPQGTADQSQIPQAGANNSPSFNTAASNARPPQ